MKKSVFFTLGLVVVAAMFLLTHCHKGMLPPPKTVRQLDVNRFMGTWNEIARLPFPFEVNCFGVSAKYEPVDDEKFLITNYCWKKSFFGPMKSAHAEAWIADETDKSKFKVSFFWPVALDYWVLYVDPNYERAIVGTPDRSYLWILSRNFNLPPEQLDELKQIAASAGYDLSQLILTPQRKNSLAEPDPDGGVGESDAGVGDEQAVDVQEVNEKGGSND